MIILLDWFNVNKVPGNFHISTHSVSTKERFIRSGFQGPPKGSNGDLNPWKPLKYDFNHVIKELYFGDPLSDVKLPGVQTNLAGSKELVLIGQRVIESEWSKMNQWEHRKRDWKHQQLHMIIHWRLSQQSIKINLETLRNRLRRPQVAT